LSELLSLAARLAVYWTAEAGIKSRISAANESNSGKKHPYENDARDRRALAIHGRKCYIEIITF
jgi:hypothetical protein